MTRQQHTTIRLPAELMALVERYREKMQGQTRMQVTRADAIRALIAAGLEAEGIN